MGFDRIFSSFRKCWDINLRVFEENSIFLVYMSEGQSRALVICLSSHAARHSINIFGMEEDWGSRKDFARKRRGNSRRNSRGEGPEVQGESPFVKVYRVGHD